MGGLCYVSNPYENKRPYSSHLFCTYSWCTDAICQPCQSQCRVWYCGRPLCARFRRLFSYRTKKVRHISLIASSGIETANDWLKAGDEPTFDGAETRRNIVLEGINANELNDLVGQHFQLGKLQMLGTELCTPCERPAQLLSKPSFMEAFEGRGGIRAEVLNSETLYVGDKLLNEKLHD